MDTGDFIKRAMCAKTASSIIALENELDEALTDSYQEGVEAAQEAVEYTLRHL